MEGAIVGRRWMNRHDRPVRIARFAPIVLVGFMGCGGEAAVPLEHPLASTHDANVSPATARVIGFAEAQVGKRYCWGGTGPDCFDCSGLVQAAWRSAGHRLPRTSGEQGKALADVPINDVRPGDILWWPHHVGIYVGNAQMIDAYHSGAGVVRRKAVVPKRVLRVPTR